MELNPLKLTANVVDSLVIFPLQQYVVRKVVEGLQCLDDALDVYPE